jgi:menaquinol-cytochrome c reductase iron-sulfur subunit
MGPEIDRTTQSSPNGYGRRTFVQWLTYGLGGLAAVIAGVPIIGFFLRTPKGPREWVTLGRVDAFPVDETRMVTFDNPIREPWDGITAHTGVYVRYEGKDQKQEDQFLVLAVNCAHLGCPVSWFPQSGLFMCPCHGGVYYGNGERASGPPPRGLFRCPWQVRNGVLEVQAPHYPTLQDTLEKPA